AERGQRELPAARGVPPGAGIHGQRDRRDPPGSDLGGRGPALPGRSGIRLRRRGGGLRPPVLSWPGPVQLGTAADEPVPLLRASGGTQGGHGVRDRDLLADRGRFGGGPDRGGGGGPSRPM